MNHPRPLTALALASAVALLAPAVHAAGANTLEGWAIMPANTFAAGPTAGQFAGAGAGGNALPLLNLQPVQGFSAVLRGAVAGSYLFIPTTASARRATRPTHCCASTA